MRVTINDLKEMKRRGERIAMLTAYDCPTARLLDEAGVPVLLVGDSLGMVILGYESTIPVTLDEMIHHTRAVSRGAKQALVVADLPFMSYQTGPVDALRSAGRLLKEGSAQAVKLEGGHTMASTIRRMVEAGIPVMGHIGLTPQSVNQLGGYKVQGKTPKAAADLVADARALDEAGVFAIVLECVPAPLARLITARVSVPTIGIGAGIHCDGEVQVITDLLGVDTSFVPRHAKPFANLGEVIKAAVAEYVADVRERRFPTPKNSFTMDEAIIAELARNELGLTPAAPADTLATNTNGELAGLYGSRQ